DNASTRISSSGRGERPVDHFTGRLPLPEGGAVASGWKCHKKNEKKWDDDQYSVANDGRVFIKKRGEQDRLPVAIPWNFSLSPCLRGFFWALWELPVWLSSPITIRVHRCVPSGPRDRGRKQPGKNTLLIDLVEGIVFGFSSICCCLFFCEGGRNN